MASNAESQESHGSHRAWRRVVVKVGTNLLTDGSDNLSSDAVKSIAHQIADLRRSGIFSVNFRVRDDD